MSVIKLGQVSERLMSCFEWKIPDCLSLIHEEKKVYASSDFKSFDEIWAFQIQAVKKQICLYLIGKSSTDSKIFCKLSVMKTDGTEYMFQEGMMSVHQSCKYTSFVMLTEMALLRSDVAPGDVLTVSCVFSYDRCAGILEEARMASKSKEEFIHTESSASCEKAGKEDNKKSISSNPKGLDIFIQNMKDLLTNELLCDITIKIKGEEIRAHRNILAARSPVFSAMFLHDMSETNTGIIDISDCEPNVFKEFLHYLYTGRKEELSLENVCGLYILGDKYDVKHLKTECEVIMRNSLTVDNFCDIFSMAVKHKESHVIQKSTEFFFKNRKSIFASVKWLTFMAENPTIANELLLKL